MIPLQPGFAGGFVLFRLFGLLFAGVARLIVVRPHAMTNRRITTSSGEVGRIEPTETQLLLTRAMAGVFVLVGLGLAFGAFP